jgi:hypothetical protein
MPQVKQYKLSVKHILGQCENHKKMDGKPDNFHYYLKVKLSYL